MSTSKSSKEIQNVSIEDVHEHVDILDNGDEHKRLLEFIKKSCIKGTWVHIRKL